MGRAARHRLCLRPGAAPRRQSHGRGAGAGRGRELAGQDFPGRDRQTRGWEGDRPGGAGVRVLGTQVTPGAGEEQCGGGGAFFLISRVSKQIAKTSNISPTFTFI